MEAPLIALAAALLLQEAPVAASPTTAELWKSVSDTVELLYQPDAVAADAMLTTDQVHELVDRVARTARPLAARHQELSHSDELAAFLEFELASFALDRADAELACRLLAPALERWPQDVALLALAAEAAMQSGEWEDAGERLAEGEGLLDRQQRVGRDPLASGLLQLERTLYELRLGRSDRALIALDALLATPGLLPEIEVAALAELADLQLLCDRPADALATAERALARHEASAVPQLALARALAMAELARAGNRTTDRERNELEVALRRPGLPTAARCLGMLRAAELALDVGERERAQGQAKKWLVAAGAVLDGGGRARLGLGRERGLHEALLARLLRGPGASSAELAEADARAEHALALLFEEWRATPLLPGGISFLRSAARRAVVHEALLAALHEQEGDGDGGRARAAKRAFQRVVEVQALGSVSRSEAMPVPSLVEIRDALLSAGELLLVYLPTRRGTHLFAVRRDELEHFELAGERELAEGAASGLARLGELLLPHELLPQIDAASLIRVVGADLFGGVTFEELPHPTLEGRMLGTFKPIASLPSVPVGIALRKRAATKSADTREIDLALVIGPETTPDGRSSFEVDERELLLPFPRSRIVPPPLEPLARGELSLPGAEIVAFVAHGIVDRRRDRFCGLLLATSSAGEPLVAWADAIERASLPPIVALVACSAAEGPVRVGEDGATHLGGAALAAGATSVLLGRGELDAEANLALLRRFLVEFAAGVPSGEALRRARVELATDPRRAGRARLELLGLGDDWLSAPPAGSTTPSRAPRSRLLAATLAGIAGLTLAIAGLWLLLSRGGRRRK